MATLVLNKELFSKVLEEQGLNMSEAAKKMGIDRSSLFKVLNDNQPFGRKFIEGALIVCEGYKMEDLFYLTEVVNKLPNDEAG